MTPLPGSGQRAKVAVVTGAGSGLGRCFATALLGDGFSVALVGRRTQLLEETAALSPARGGALVLPADVAEPAAVAEVFGAVVARWGRVDVLVNNAGTFGPSGDVDELDVEEWRRTVEVNLTGTFLCAREAFAVMKRQDPRGGRIVNIGSVSAQTPRPGSAAYTATKHAVTGLTKALALDGRRHGIACGQIDIGNAATEMTAGFAAGARQPDGSLRPEPTFDPQHAADAVLRMAQLPLDVNVLTMTIMATAMPYVGRG